MKKIKLYILFLLRFSIFKGKVVSNPKKAYFLKKIGIKNKINVFVETGTYFGDTLSLLKNCFKKLYSIEISKDIYNVVLIRFMFSKHISLLNGDSVECLNKILVNIHEPVLFWLDAHYSAGITGKGLGNTPIENELIVIKKYFIHGSVIAIDDAHLFIGKDGYPKQSKLVSLLKSIDTNLVVTKKDNIFVAKEI